MSYRERNHRAVLLAADDRLRPAGVRGFTGDRRRLHVYVGSVTAVFADFATVIGGELPVFIGVIIGLAGPSSLRR